MSSIVDILLVKKGAEVSNNVSWDTISPIGEIKAPSIQETKNRIETRATTIANAKVTNSPVWNETTVAPSASCIDSRINAKVSDSPSWTSTTIAPSSKAADDRINAKVSNSTNWSAPSCTIAPSENSVGAQITSVANAKVTDSPVWNETTVAPSARSVKSLVDSAGSVSNSPAWNETNIAPSAGATETRINAKVSNSTNWTSPSCTVAPSENAVNSRISSLIGDNLRSGISSLKASGAIDLATDNSLVFNINYNTVSGTVATGSINFTNGTPGQVIYLKVNSGGSESYSFGSNMKWPSNISPTPSVTNKIDIYSFVCIESSKFLGTFAFNYD